MWLRLNGCPGVTALHGVFQDCTAVYLAQELCSGGDLQSLLDAQEVLSEGEAAQAAGSILAALAECHARGICYGDVKPGNFLIKDMYPSLAHIIDPGAPRGALQLRIADFGCSQRCEAEDQPCLTKISGTPIYIAPEVLLGAGYNTSSDVWSVGVLLYQMLTHRFPFWEMDAPYIRAIPSAQIFDDIAHAQVLPDERIPPGAWDLLERMLTRDPRARISAAHALQHPWLQSVLAGAQ
jgi:serine/threonine protein kinase